MIFCCLYFEAYSQEKHSPYCFCDASCQSNLTLRKLWEHVDNQCMQKTELERVVRGRNRNLKDILDQTKRWVTPLFEEINDKNRTIIKNDCSSCDVISEITMKLDIPEERKKDIKKTCHSSYSSTHHFYYKEELEPDETCSIEKQRMILESFDFEVNPFMDPRMRGESGQSKTFYDQCPVKSCDATFTKVLRINPVTCQGHLELTANCTDLLPKKWLILTSVPFFDVRIIYKAKLQCLKKDHPQLCSADYILEKPVLGTPVLQESAFANFSFRR